MRTLDPKPSFANGCFLQLTTIICERLGRLTWLATPRAALRSAFDIDPDQLPAFLCCQSNKLSRTRMGHELMSEVDTIDFHVAILSSGAAGGDWLVYRGPPSACVIVAFCGSCESATDRARTMAQYHCSIGKKSRVVVHDEHDDGSSRVVWPQDQNRGQGQI